jgi:RHS repeat-associated protein
VFNGDKLVWTIDQQLASGVATGSPATHYIHPDHLGSTNVVTDASGGSCKHWTTILTAALALASGQNAESRQYIGQFSDNSGLSYLNARYYDGSRGQFLSEDAVFLGDPKQQNLQDPQSLNAYSYAEDNPITGSDPSGRCGPLCVGLLALLAPQAVGDPIFNFNGSISSTPQQTTINAAGFAGQLVSDTEEISALSAARPLSLDKLTTSIEVNGSSNEVTDLPYAIPSGIGAKVIFGGLGITALIAYGEEYFQNSIDAGNDFGGACDVQPYASSRNGERSYAVF